MAVNRDAAKDAKDQTVTLRIKQGFRELRTGDKALDDFLKEIDRVFALCPGDVDKLRAALEHETSQHTLPDDVVATIFERIAAATLEYEARGGQPVVASVDITYESEAVDGAGADESAPELTSITNSRGESNGKRTVLNERYVLIECVGVGGSSTVFKALDRRRLLFEDPFPFVAVKILNDKLRARTDWLEVLKQEAIKCHQLKHPNIIRVYDFLRDGHRVYITMEFLSGSPLTQIVRTRDFNGMPQKEALRIVDRMASALKFAHERGIVHRDFKPANIFRTDDGEVKLIDFGIAQIFGEGSASSGSDEETAKPEHRPRHAVTPAYASPELLERCDPDPRDDVYSLACTTYELLTGTHPFGYKSALEARVAGLTVPTSRSITPTQLAAIRHALDFDRDRRTPTIAQFMAEFTAVPKVNNDRLLLAATMAVFMAALTWLYYYHKAPGTALVAESGDVNSDAELGDIPTAITSKDSLATAEQPDRAVPAVTTGVTSAKAVSVPPRSTASEPVTTTTFTSNELAQEHRVSPPPATTGSTGPAESAKSAQTTVETVQRFDQLGYQQLAEGKLTLPAHENAAESFRSALRLDPKDQKALEGLNRIAEKFRDRALVKLKADDLNGSLALVKQGLRVNDRHVGLRKLQRELTEAVTALQAGKPKNDRTVAASVAQNAGQPVAAEAASLPSSAEVTTPVPVAQTGKPRIRIFGGF